MKTFFFFIALHLILGKKSGLILGGASLNSDLCSSQIFVKFLPPFQNPAYATGPTYIAGRTKSLAADQAYDAGEAAS